MNKKDFADRALNKILDGNETEASRAWLASMAMKCNDYQQFYPGFRFPESLVNWLSQFNDDDVKAAFTFVKERLIYISESQIRLLVESAFSTHMRPRLLDAVANQCTIPPHKVKALVNSKLYEEGLMRSLFLGLSDGARTDVFRRYNPQLDNEQVWLTYSVSEEKTQDFIDYLHKYSPAQPSFNHLWLMDDFSASGKSFLRKDDEQQKWKGKIVKTLSTFLTQGTDNNESDTTQILADKCRVYIVLYIASCQAEAYFKEQIDMLWGERTDFAERFTKPDLIVIQSLNDACQISQEHTYDTDIIKLIDNDDYYDHDKLYNQASKVGDTEEVRYGFAEGRLPLVLGHNTPNNSISMLWAFETANFIGLFPRISRH